MAILSGYKRVCRRNVGGVSLVALIPVQNIASVTSAKSEVSKIEFAKDAKMFVEYQSSLDGAEFKISSSEQSIMFRFNALSPESSNAYNELLDIAPCGLAALVHMNNGEVALLGWSEEFNGRRPLMQVENEGTSGKGITDENYLDVTLKTTQVTAPLYLSEELVKTIDTLLEANAA